MKAFNKIFLFFLLAIITWACQEEEYKQATVTIVNGQNCPVEEGSEQFVSVTLFTSQVLDENGTVTIDLQDDAVQTTPAADGRFLTLTIPAGDDQVTFNLSYGEDNEGLNKSLPITISSVSGGIQSIGQGVYLLQVIDNDNLLFTENFDELCENGQSLPGKGWTVYSVASQYSWRCTLTGRGASEETGDYGFEMNNFGSPDGEGADDWIITPELNFRENAVLSYNSVKRYAGSTVEVLYSSNYETGENPSDYTWTEITAASDAFDDDQNSWTYVSSGNIALTGITGKKHLAFRVTSTGTASGGASTIRVDDVAIQNASLSTTGGCFGDDDDDDDGDNGGGDGPVAVDAPYAENFNSCADGSVAGWSEYSMSSNSNWECSGDTRGATGDAGDFAKEMSGFEADAASEDWLISPAINVGTDGVFISFKSTTRYTTGNLEVFYSTDYSGAGDPSEASWTSFTAANEALDDNPESWDYVPSGDLDISHLSGTVHFAFVYTSTGPGSAESGTVRIDDFEVKGTSDGGGGGGDITPLAFPFTTDFDDCTTDYATPDLFKEAFVTGAMTNRGWGCRGFGVDGSRAVRASAYVAPDAEGADNAWLITEGPIDMSAATDVYVHFMVSSMYSGPGTIHLKWSENYSGSGDPSSATWTEVDISSQLPDAGSDNYEQVSVNIPALAGKTAYVAFQYVDALASTAASWDIDNLEITDSATPGDF